MEGYFGAKRSANASIRPLHNAGRIGRAKDDLIGDSPQMRSLRETVDRVAHTHITVVVTGETGTGKELVARRLHLMSNRSNAPFIAVNCAAIPDTLIESELFGFEKGAFTGAAGRTDGILMRANRGTIFLDEIGELSSAAQAKLLRVLEDREVRRIGSSYAHAVDLRFVAATNRTLEKLVQEQRFRDDLLYRLNVITIDVPPLRERQADIQPIAEYFLRELSRRYHCPAAWLTTDAVEFLQKHAWPGNVRELRNVIERSFVLRTSDRITEKDLFLTHASPVQQMHIVRSPESRIDSIHEMERLRHALQVTCWNKSKTAQMLNWSRMTVYRKILKYDLTQ